jgi:hypothetical protein
MLAKKRTNGRVFQMRPHFQSDTSRSGTFEWAELRGGHLLRSYADALKFPHIQSWFPDEFRCGFEHEIASLEAGWIDLVSRHADHVAVGIGA